MVVDIKSQRNKKVCDKTYTYLNYKDSLFNDEIILQSQQRFKSDYHKVYTEEVNKVALSSNDDMRLQTFDKITTYPYGMKQEAKASFEETNKYKW